MHTIDMHSHSLKLFVLFCGMATIAFGASPFKWNPIASMPQNRSDFLSMKHDGQIYVMGGCVADQPLDLFPPCPAVSNTFFKLDVQTDIWTQLPPAPTARWRYMSAVYENEIYYVGGRTQADDIIQNIDIYNISGNVWRSVSGSIDRSDGFAFVKGTKMYVVGGYTQIYEPLANTAELNLNTIGSSAAFTISASVPSRSVASGDLGGVVYNDKVYVFGGFGRIGNAVADFCTPLKTMEVFDLFHGQWHRLTDLTRGVGDMAYAVVENYLFIPGGELKASDCLTSTAESGVYAFDLQNNVWKLVSYLPQAKFRSSAFSYGTKIYHHGGQSSPAAGVYPTLGDGLVFDAKQFINTNKA